MYGQTAMQNFMPIVKVPAEKFVTVQNERKTRASARTISRHMAPIDSEKLGHPWGYPFKIGEDLSETWPNRHEKFHADR